MHPEQRQYRIRICVQAVPECDFSYEASGLIGQIAHTSWNSQTEMRFATIP